MSNVEEVKIESDERGFELHLVVDDDPMVDPDTGRMILNVQAVAEELYDAVKGAIGPWLQEMHDAKREYDTGIADDPAQQEVLDRIRGVELEDEGPTGIAAFYSARFR